MSAFIRKSSPEALELVVRGTSVSGQYIVECQGPLEDFDREYFAVSGYFGVHGPHLFAAAPELLAALALALEYWADRQQRYRNRAPRWVVDARAAIAKARGAA